MDKANKLMRLNWEELHRMIERVVKQGLAQRELYKVEHVCLMKRALGENVITSRL